MPICSNRQLTKLPEGPFFFLVFGPHNVLEEGPGAWGLELEPVAWLVLVYYEKMNNL